MTNNGKRSADVNRLFYGDNLDVLGEHIADESVDLVYLDPPFNSNADYNVLFAERDGRRAAAQIQAFTDTWEWNQTAARTFEEAVERGGRVADALVGLRKFLGESDMLAYLAMMAPRLVELRRILKPSGSLYLHCDPNASHYLRMLLDAVFGPEHFRNELIWKRTSAHGDASRRCASVHDTILVYGRSKQTAWHQTFSPYSQEYVDEHFVHKDPGGRLFRRVDLRSPNPRPNLTYDYRASNGRLYRPHRNGWAVSIELMRQLDDEGRLFFPAKEDGRLRRKIYLDESPGVLVSDVWVDLPPIHASSQERLGYPTQKPEALLERIITASSREGDVVLDAFCGCGTTIAAAHKLNRRWIGIDITHLAITLIRHRLVSSYGPDVEKTFTVVGEPVDVAGAEQLAREDPHQFQIWALGRVGARPTELKKGADRGIDGRLYFHDARGGDAQMIVISVKGGERISSPFVRDLRGVVEREDAAIGVLLTMHPPTREMEREAASAGFYASPWGGKHPKLQILTVEQLLAGQGIDYPPAHQTNVTFKPAPRAKLARHKQGELPILAAVKPAAATTSPMAKAGQTTRRQRKRGA